MKRISPIERLQIASPCTADWTDMRGNDRVRFCQHCELSVHNLSAMTTAEAVKLVAAARGRICVRYYQQPDGSIQTALPLVQINARGRRASRLATGAFSAALTLGTSAAAHGATITQGSATLAPAAQAQRAQTGAWKDAGGAGSVAGTVIDANGGCIPNAVIKLKDAQGHEQTTKTDDEGRFQLPAQPGAYELTIEAQDFRRLTRPVTVQAQAVTRADAVLNVEAALMGAVAISLPAEPLVAAAQSDDVPAVQALLARGDDVNVLDKVTDKTALMAAADNGNLQLVQLLLGAGAKLNARNEYGQTALMHLGANATPELIRLLVGAGAKLNFTDKDGDTALMNIARWGKAEALRALVEAGAKVNERNHNGDTALMLAAAEAELDNVKVLLNAGADVNRRNNDRQTALQQARANDDDEIVQLLIAYGSIVDPEPEKKQP